MLILIGHENITVLCGGGGAWHEEVYRVGRHCRIITSIFLHRR